MLKVFEGDFDRTHNFLEFDWCFDGGKPVLVREAGFRAEYFAKGFGANAAHSYSTLIFPKPNSWADEFGKFSVKWFWWNSVFTQFCRTSKTGERLKNGLT